MDSSFSAAGRSSDLFVYPLDIPYERDFSRALRNPDQLHSSHHLQPCSGILSAAWAVPHFRFPPLRCLHGLRLVRVAPAVCRPACLVPSLPQFGRQLADVQRAAGLVGSRARYRGAVLFFVLVAWRAEAHFPCKMRHRTKNVRLVCFFSSWPLGGGSVLLWVGTAESCPFS